MKGFFISLDFVATVLITVLVVSILVIALQYWFPAFVASSCASKQTEDINGLINSAIQSTGTSVKGFVVESCMEYVDFSEVYCSFDKSDKIDLIGMRRCYEMLEKGQNSGNCLDNPNSPGAHDIYATRLYKVNPKTEDGVTTYEYEQIGCGDHKGTVRYIPVGPRVMQIESEAGSCGFPSGQGDTACRFKPGKYAVEVGTYSIKFLGTQDSREAG